MFEISDFRNARYQGETKNGIPHGIGIAIDFNFLFCLAEWTDGKIDGSTFIVFPDSRIFCGRIYDNQISEICSFYLQDRIQMFANYSEGQNRTNNFVAMLPFCKVLLEIDRNGPYPKASRHQTYSNTQQNSLMNKLIDMLGNNVDLTEFLTWKDFLQVNFVKPYSNKIYWKQTQQASREQVFFGLKPQGLGVRIINLIDEKEMAACDGDCFIVSSMGSYSKLHELNGMGIRLVDYSKYKMNEQGVFGDNKTDNFQYPRNNRPIHGPKMFLRELKISTSFKNIFLDLQFCYQLLRRYEKINIQLMEENRKIAQVIIQNKHDSVVLAELQDKKQRKLTPQRYGKRVDPQYQTTKQIQQSKQASQIEKFSSRYKMNTKTSYPISVNPETRKSIFSSVQKIKKSKNSPKKSSDKVVQRYNHTQKIQYYQSSPQNYLYERAPSQQNYQRIDKLAQQPRQLIRNKESKKYLYQKVLEDPNSLVSSYLDAKAQKPSTYFQKNASDSSTKYHSQDYFPYQEKNQRKINYDRTANRTKSPYKLAQNSFPQPQRHHKSRNHQDQKTIQKKKVKEDQDLISFFNKQIEEGQPKSNHIQLNRIVGYPQPSSNHFSNQQSKVMKRQKTPGKIVVFKKKYNQDNLLQ